MFLNVTANVSHWSADEKEFRCVPDVQFDHSCVCPYCRSSYRCLQLSHNVHSILIEENPLTEFVELPDTYAGLHYCNVLCGVIRGALEMVRVAGQPLSRPIPLARYMESLTHATQVQMRVECKIVKCVLKGDEFTELRVSFKEYLGVRSPCFSGRLIAWRRSL